MKKLIIYLSCAILIAVALSLLIGAAAPDAMLNTLYTVAGVVFSVGMSIAISPKTDEVTNADMKRDIRRSYKMVRDSFISFFAFDTMLFVLAELDVCQRTHQVISMICTIFTLLSVIYFVFNFIQLQKFGDEIEDQVLKERALNEQ